MAEEQTPPKTEEKQSPTSKKTVLWLVAILLLLTTGGVLGWQMWQGAQQEETPPASTPAPAAVESPTPPSPPANPAPATPAPVTISASLKENTEAAISTMNTAALEGYMTDPVTVVLAASEKGGPETPAQAVKDLDYLSGATNWNWNLSAATLTSYKNGSYGQYFPENSVVGKSANSYVVSFTVNANNKITTVFMTNSAELLQ